MIQPTLAHESTRSCASFNNCIPMWIYYAKKISIDAEICILVCYEKLHLHTGILDVCKLPERKEEGNYN